VGLYREWFVPYLIDRACGAKAFVPWRERTCEGLFGVVVEIGFGSGHNVPLYPPGVELVYALEPASRALALARRRLAASPVRVVTAGADAQSIDLPDGSCDAALSTFALCTIPNPVRALSEVRRVLRPGGRLHFLDHGVASRPGLARIQRALDPWEVRLAGGCHLTREPLALVTGAGFVLEWSEVGRPRGPAPWCQFSAGVARAA
jgi:SAM-dependent methyltransferase